MMPMMPKISVRPAASRNSVTPSCTPLSICSTKRDTSSPLCHNTSGARLPRAALASGYQNRKSLHLAIFGVGIGVVRQDLGVELESEAVSLFDHLQRIPVLDRMLVSPELEWTARE